MIKQRRGVAQMSGDEKFMRIRHLPRALEMANARAERWRQRYLTAGRDRDEAQATVARATKLYTSYMKWDGDPDSEFSSSPHQRAQLAEALGIEHD